jgi:hypothetical protein
VYAPGRDKVRGPFVEAHENDAQELCTQLGVNELCLASTYFRRNQYAPWRHPQQPLASAGPLGGVTEKDLKRATNAGRMGYFGKDSDHVPIFLRVRISSARGTMLGVMSRSPPAAAGRGQVSFERTQQWQFSFGRMSWMGCLETRAQYRNRINCKKRYAQQRRLRSLPRSESPQGGTRQRNAAQTMYNRVITPHITATL